MPEGTTTEAPTTTTTIKQKARPVDGEWINCGCIRIDEGILDHQRVHHMDLPEIWFTHEDVCSYRVTGPDAAIEYFDLQQLQRSDGQASAKIQLLKRLDR